MEHCMVCHLSISILHDSDEDTLDTGQTWTNHDVTKQNAEVECGIANV